jgi:hypothetical protein
MLGKNRTRLIPIVGLLASAAAACTESTAAPPGPAGCGEDFISLEYRYPGEAWERVCMPLSEHPDGRKGILPTALPTLDGMCVYRGAGATAADTERHLIVTVSGVVSPDRESGAHTDWWRTGVGGSFAVSVRFFSEGCREGRVCQSRSLSCSGEVVRRATAVGDLTEVRVPGPCALADSGLSPMLLHPEVRNVVLRGHLLAPTPDDAGVSCMIEFP